MLVRHTPFFPCAQRHAPLSHRLLPLSPSFPLPQGQEGRERLQSHSCPSPDRLHGELDSAGDSSSRQVLYTMPAPRIAGNTWGDQARRRNPPSATAVPPGWPGAPQNTKVGVVGEPPCPWDRRDHRDRSSCGWWTKKWERMRYAIKGKWRRRGH